MSLKIKLHDLLVLQDQFYAEPAIKNSLGDSFLYHHNTIYKNVRDQFYKLGFKFTDKDFCNYTVFPYLSLSKILNEKMVPYFDNVSVLKEVEHSRPKKLTVEELIPVKPNNTLHESSHCIADYWLKQINLDSATITGDQKKAFLLIMAESFANTVESLANLDNDTFEQRFFFNQNSYIQMNKKTYQNLKQTIDLIGLKSTYHLVYVSYLYSNCLNQEIKQKEFQQILEIINIKESAVLKKLFDHAFELSLDFRVQTSSFYFIMSGIEQNIFKLLQIDILDLIKKTGFLKQFFHGSDHLFST